MPRQPRRPRLARAAWNFRPLAALVRAPAACVALAVACQERSGHEPRSTPPPSDPSVVSVAVAPSAGTLAPAPAPDPYVSDAHFRRATLEASLENPGNDYSVLRLSHYDTGAAGDWSRLPEWNPPAEPVMPADLDAPRPTTRAGSAAPPIGASARPSRTDGTWLEIGEDAFFRYPVQLTSPGPALGSRAAAERVGFWIDPARGVGGLVRARMADGSSAYAVTCATCHARADAEGLAVGAANDRFDLGRIIVDASRGLSRDVADRYLAWGPGRVDVTTSKGTEPVRISDLRPTRWLTHLQHAGAVRQKSLAALAIRIETLIITSHNMVLRPPRVITRGLAAYVWSLADRLPSSEPKTAAERRGAALFASECVRCHEGEGMSGGPVPFASVGTSDALGQSNTRGTGGYRVPSLRGVGARSMLLHDASLATLESMFDPARLKPTYQGGRRPGPVPGHAFGLEGWSSVDRAALVAFLRTR